MPTEPPCGRSPKLRPYCTASLVWFRLSRFLAAHPSLVLCRPSTVLGSNRRRRHHRRLRPQLLKMKPSSQKSPKDKGKGIAIPCDDPSDNDGSDGDGKTGKGRSGNWIDEETEVLLDVVREYKLQRGWNHINIKHFGAVHRIFKSKLPGSTRTKENLRNRLKHLKQQYSAAKRFTNYSGGDCWDYNKHKLNLSSQSLEEIISTNEKGLQFLRRPFPWFATFDTLCGGTRAEGDRQAYFGDESDDGEGSGSTDNSRGRVEGRIHVDADDGAYTDAPPGFDFGQWARHNQSQFSNGLTQQTSQTRTYRPRGRNDFWSLSFVISTNKIAGCNRSD